MKCSQSHLYLEAFGQFSGPLSKSVIVIRRVLVDTVGPLIQRFLETVFDVVDYQNFFVAVASGVLMAVNRPVTIRFGVSDSTLMDMWLMRELTSSSNSVSERGLYFSLTA